MRGEILNGRAGRDYLSLVAGNVETNFEKALLQGGKGLLNRRRPTSNDPITEEEGVAVKLTWKARFSGPSSLSDARVECQSEQRRASPGRQPREMGTNSREDGPPRDTVEGIGQVNEDKHPVRVVAESVCPLPGSVNN